MRALAVAAAVVVIVVGGFHIISRLFDDASGSRIDMPSASPPGQSEPPRSQGGPPPVQPDAPARKEPPHVQANRFRPTGQISLSPAPLSGKSCRRGQRRMRSRPSARYRRTPRQLVATPRWTVARPSRRAGTRKADGHHRGDAGSTPAARTDFPASPRPPAALPTSFRAAIGGPKLAHGRGRWRSLGRLRGRGPIRGRQKASRPTTRRPRTGLRSRAKKGIVPAQFRLGTLYEKGLGVKKDLDRRARPLPRRR